MFYKSQYRKISWSERIGHHVTKKDVTIPKTNLAIAKRTATKLPVPPKIANIPQYYFNGEHTPIKENIPEFLKEQIIVPTTILPYNHPIWPVKKPDESYSFRVDYRNLNKHSPKTEGTPPDAATNIDNIALDPQLITQWQTYLTCPFLYLLIKRANPHIHMGR